MIVQQSKKRTRKIVIWSGKGGSGKTTTAQNLAFWLAAAGYYVALMDTDSFANSSNFINMFAIPQDRRYTLSHVIQQEKPLLAATYRVRNGLYVIPSDDQIEAASNYIVIHEAQEIMLEKYTELMETLGEPPASTPIWKKHNGKQDTVLAPRHLAVLQSVEDVAVLEPPPYLDFLIFDFPAELNALGRAILKIPDIEIWSSVVLEPLPLQGFAQMKKQLDKLFKNYPDRKPPIKGVIPYHLTHKKGETAEEFVKLYLNHRDVFQRAVHEDLNVPPTQNIYPAKAIYEVKRTSRAARELFEIAMRLGGYDGPFEGSPDCRHCNDIHAWIQKNMAAIKEGA
jgi:cellulose biosynthesis protein BcsQ